jgi:hypothetical protein
MMFRVRSAELSCVGGGALLLPIKLLAPAVVYPIAAIRF